jgi:hypothetical protein
MATDFLDRCEVIEECYEFLLAYAGQGLRTDEGSAAGGQVRSFLEKAAAAMRSLAERCRQSVRENELEPESKYMAFCSALERDAQDSLAAIELVLAQPSISSQLIDNLNASSHLRALLTDLFLIGEILRARVPESSRVRENPTIA